MLQINLIELYLIRDLDKFLTYFIKIYKIVLRYKNTFEMVSFIVVIKLMIFFYPL